MISYELFLSIIQEAKICNDWDGKVEEELEERWTTGGICGGSWMGCEPDDYSPREIEPEPDFERLDKIIELFWPNIGFIQYKNLVREVVLVRTGFESEDYYGNNEIYSKKLVNLNTLYQHLYDRGVLV